MKKIAKDVTLGDLLATESGLMRIHTVSTDMINGTTMLGRGAGALIFDPYETVEIVED